MIELRMTRMKLINLDQERDLLASLIQKLKCEIDDSKIRNKFLESSNKVLVMTSVHNSSGLKPQCQMTFDYNKSSLEPQCQTTFEQNGSSLDCTSMSTAEAEYVSLSACCTQVL
ncbi:hypothetical protein Tco_0306790, partial [Tanacetum coccineum]